MEEKDITKKGRRPTPKEIGIGAAVLAAAIILALLIGRQAGGKKMAEVREVALADIQDTAITEQILEDAKTPGYYLYDAGDGGAYTLLTYGEVLNLVLDVMPQVEEQSVYFKVSFTEVSETEPHLEYKLFWTDAESIGGDENYLKFPGYGVGVSGYNYGWVEPAGDGFRYITPLDETRMIDRVYELQPGAEMGIGLYRYEYELTSTGLKVIEARPLEDYSVWCVVTNVDETACSCTLLIGDERVALTAYFPEDALPTVQQMTESGIQKKVTLINQDEKPFMALNADAAATPDGEGAEENG